ncbi:MAG: class II aldolase/adducin family protein [FCB group bacterium]|jgi:rhamnose utilization protein RhaD (predicted bifunctional aldolase and dehydrogenase)|nr:class II aldolase/adducin family protein [FCB group bacterium]
MEHVIDNLVHMTRYLANPAKGYAILGEGNTSARIDDDTFWVKASGTVMDGIEPRGFVRVSISKVLELLDDESAGDDQVTQVLKDALVDPNENRRPSVETLLHAILLRVPEIKYVGHTHPVFTNSLLCSKIAAEAVSGRICPDHIVCMGHKSVYIPYVDPGLQLAREVKRQFERFVEEEGVLPRAIMMESHGFIAMGENPRAVTSCTDMCEKISHILVGTYAVGGPRFMPPADVNRIFTRPDEAYRLKSLAG